LLAFSWLTLPLFNPVAAAKIPKNAMNYFFRPPVMKTNHPGVNKIGK
jgi:hypothetical protein